MSKEMDDVMVREIVRIIEKYLPWLLLDTEFLKNGKIRELNFSEQRHFIGVLTLKRSGALDKTYYSKKALDSLVAAHLEIGRKTCSRLHGKLQSLDLVDEDWQPLGWKRWQYDKSRRMVSATDSIARAYAAQQERNRPMTDAERARVYRERKKSVDSSTSDRHECVTPRHECVTPRHDERHEKHAETRDENSPNVTPENTEKNQEYQEVKGVSSRNFSLHIHKQEQEHLQKTEGEEKNGEGVQGDAPDAAPQAATPPAPNAASAVVAVVQAEQPEPTESRNHGEHAEYSTVSVVQPESQLSQNASHPVCQNVQECPKNAAQGPASDELIPGQGLPQKTQPAAAFVPQQSHVAAAAAVVVHGEGTTAPVVAKKKKGTSVGDASRLPQDWVLPRQWGEWALQERPDFEVADVRLEAEKFADYWRSKSGKDACKRDWQATWRNWIRSEYCKGNAFRRGGQQAKNPNLPPLTFKEMDELNLLRSNAALFGERLPRQDELEARLAANNASPMGMVDVVDVDARFQRESVVSMEVSYDYDS